MIPFAGWLALTLGAPQVSVTNDTLLASGFDPSWVLGYHVGYEASDYPTDKVDFDALTHVVIGVVIPNADATLDTSYDIDANSGPAWASGVATVAHAANRKVLLMIGGSDTRIGFAGASSSANRATFVANLLAEMDARGADGLDLDWEPLDTGDYPAFVALAQALRTARPSILLTVPVYSANANFQNPSAPDPFFGSIAPLFDRINVMTYGMAGVYDGWNSWFTSALKDHSPSTPSSVESSVDFYLASGVPRSKLGIGIGFYGICYAPDVSGPRQALVPEDKVVGDDNTHSYHNVVTKYYSLANYHYDAPAESAYLGSDTPFGPGGECGFLPYEDATSITAKGAWTRRNGLAGTIIWSIGKGYVPEQVGSENALLQSVHDAFLPGQQ